MDVLNIDELKELMQERNEPSISIYIPTHRKGAEVEQDHIRFKNQLREVEQKLTERKYRKNEIENLLNPAKELVDDIDFWNHQSDGLAVFISPGEFVYYRVPQKFDERNFISDRYYLRPFIPVMNGNERFLILALNQKNVRLFEATKFSINEIELKNVPTSIEEFLETEEEDRSLQFHTQTSRQTLAGKSHIAGARSAMFHEHGGGSDGAIYKEKIHQFFILVDNGLQKYLNNEKAPLLLAGIEYLLPIYKETNFYPYTLDETLPVNTQDLNDQELRDAGWEIVKKRMETRLENALVHYGNYSNTVRATDKVEEIIRNVFSNRILYLFINPEVQLWGKFDIDSYRVEVHNVNYEPDDIDLIDLATEQTLLHNGIVFSVSADRMPNGKPMAALFRY